jgi:hypothetical protein
MFLSPHALGYLEPSADPFSNFRFTDANVIALNRPLFPPQTIEDLSLGHLRQKQNPAIPKGRCHEVKPAGRHILKANNQPTGALQDAIGLLKDRCWATSVVQAPEGQYGVEGNGRYSPMPRMKRGGVFRHGKRSAIAAHPFSNHFILGSMEI